MTIVKQDNELMKLKKEELKRIIQDNQLNVKREECVWEIVVKWIDEDPHNRTNDLAFLLPGIRFGLMNVKYFVDNVILLFASQTAWLANYYTCIYCKTINHIVGQESLLHKKPT